MKQNKRKQKFIDFVAVDVATTINTADSFKLSQASETCLCSH